MLRHDCRSQWPQRSSRPSAAVVAFRLGPTSPGGRPVRSRFDEACAARDCYKNWSGWRVRIVLSDSMPRRGKLPTDQSASRLSPETPLSLN